MSDVQTLLDFPHRMLAIQPMGGLACRMKCIASFSVVAKYMHLPLYVSWETSAGFEPIAVSVLFEAVPTNVVLIDEPSWTRLRTKVPSAYLERVIPYLKTRVVGVKTNFSLAKTVFNNRLRMRYTAQCAYELSGYSLADCTSIIPDFEKQMQDHLAMFVPIEPIRRIVRSEVAAWSTPAVGVHVRRDDIAQSSRLAQYYSKTDDHFRAEVRDALLAGSIVFLATDDASMHDALQAEYAHNPAFRSFAWKRHAHAYGTPKGGQKKALVDMCVLQCCSRVVGTPGSTFSWAGAQRAWAMDGGG